MIKAVFFDMNETLLNLEPLKTHFDKHFKDEYVLKYWFTKLLQTSLVMASMNAYKNFGELAGVVLESVFHEGVKSLSEDEKASILNTFRSMPAFEDVPEALKMLKDNNLKVIAVSNSSLTMMEEQLTNAGIIKYFDGYYSVDAVARYKPFEDIYKFVANEELLDVSEVVMVASHDWDLFGAKSAGLKTAYIKRKDVIYNPFYSDPDIDDDHMVKLAEKIVRLKD